MSMTAAHPTGLFDRAARWLSGRLAARRAVRELDACGSELAFIARDVSLSEHALKDLAKHPPRSARLLARRMAALRLDPGEIGHNRGAVLQDLQRVCTGCTHKRRCDADLRVRPADPVWQDYCPNAGTLGVLQARWPS